MRKGTMQIRDLGEEAIYEILSEAVDGMGRRTGKAWRLAIENEHGDLAISCEGKLVTTANVRPHLPPLFDDAGEEVPLPPLSIRFRGALRRLVLDATQAVSPVPGAANNPLALTSVFSAVAAVEAATERKDFTFLPAIRHDLHRALDYLTGCDHSGCSGKPSVAEYGRVEETA